ncbi:MAG: hypothetical protein AAFZ18_09030 [Myxococcota bacterium]
MAKQDDEKGSALKKARKVRSPFGTQVARKVTCSSCGAEDTIHFAPRPGQQPLCRRCAADILGVVDAEANIGPEHREKCERCELFVVRPCDFEDPLSCPEHARALAMKQGQRSRSATRTASGALRIRRNPKGS